MPWPSVLVAFGMMSGPESRTCARRIGAPVSAETMRPLIWPVPVFICRAWPGIGIWTALFTADDLDLRGRGRREDEQQQNEQRSDSAHARILRPPLLRM